jgi:hypothetical protein
VGSARADPDVETPRFVDVHIAHDFAKRGLAPILNRLAERPRRGVPAARDEPRRTTNKRDIGAQLRTNSQRVSIDNDPASSM